MELRAGSEGPHLMQPSKEPGLKGTPWPMSPSSRSPSVSRSKAASTSEERTVWVPLLQIGVVGRPVISATGRLRQEHLKLGTSLGYMARPDLNQKSNLAAPHQEDSHVGTRQSKLTQHGSADVNAHPIVPLF